MCKCEQTLQQQKPYNNVERFWTGFHYCISCNLSIASPSMRGSTPLDVAAASVMDNNELALALQEPDLEKVKYP